MNNIHIENSYKIWKTSMMNYMIKLSAMQQYQLDPEKYLNRSYTSMYIEWWLHSICYYATLPLCKIKFFADLNLRAKHVDLEKH